MRKLILILLATFTLVSCGSDDDGVAIDDTLVYPHVNGLTSLFPHITGVDALNIQFQLRDIRIETGMEHDVAKMDLDSLAIRLAVEHNEFMQIEQVISNDNFEERKKILMDLGAWDVAELIGFAYTNREHTVHQWMVSNGDISIEGSSDIILDPKWDVIGVANLTTTKPEYLTNFQFYTIIFIDYKQ